MYTTRKEGREVHWRKGYNFIIYVAVHILSRRGKGGGGAGNIVIIDLLSSQEP